MATAGARMLSPVAPEQTFTLFPNLPVELQTQIWEFALPGPRVIEIRKRWRTVVQGLAQQDYAVSQADPVPLLYTCHCSRVIALKTYKLSFSSQLAYPTYFDPSQDTVLMADLPALEYVLHKRSGSLSRDTVRYSAIDPTNPLNINAGVLGPTRSTRTHDITNNGVSYLAQAIKRYRSLEELLILYPVEGNNQIPAWFEGNAIDLLEEALERLGFDPKDMPQVVCLPYQAKDRGSGRRRAVHDWMNNAHVLGRDIC